MNWYKKQPEKARLSIRDAVTQWGDSWAWFAPQEFTRLQIELDQARDSEAIVMRCYETGRLPRISERDIEGTI